MKLRFISIILGAFIFMAGFLTSVALMHKELINAYQGIGLIFASLGISVVILIINSIGNDR